jgi:uncharacterized protein YdiU (UPF0061 family)
VAPGPARKLGLATQEEGDAALAFDLLDLMAKGEADFTNTFRALSGTTRRRRGGVQRSRRARAHGSAAWRARLAREGRDEAARVAAMQAVNPALIPRNHRVEEAISAALAGDFAPFERLVAVLARPFDPAEGDLDLATPPAAEERVTQTFCGT